MRFFSEAGTTDMKIRHMPEIDKTTTSSKITEIIFPLNSAATYATYSINLIQKQKEGSRNDCPQENLLEGWFIQEIPAFYSFVKSYN